MVRRLVSYTKVAFYSALVSVRVNKVAKSHGKISAGNFRNIIIGKGVVFNHGVYIQLEGKLK